VQIHL